MREVRESVRRLIAMMVKYASQGSSRDVDRDDKVRRHASVVLGGDN